MANLLEDDQRPRSPEIIHTNIAKNPMNGWNATVVSAESGSVLRSFCREANQAREMQRNYHDEGLEWD